MRTNDVNKKKNKSKSPDKQVILNVIKKTKTIKIV